MKQLILGIIAPAIWYAFGSFIGWEANPSSWEESSRFLLVALVLCSWAAVADWYYSENKK